MNTSSGIVSGRLSDDQKMKVLHISFNQDQGCFSIAHEKGFLVYNTNPMDLRVHRTFSPSGGSSTGPGSGSGIGLVSMLHRTNYLALVGGGRTPKFPNNKVIIWDDLKKRPSLSLSFMSPVINVLLSRSRIVVVLSTQVVVYEFSSPPNKIATYETIENSQGLADLSVQTFSSLTHSKTENTKTGPKCQFLAFPGRAVGQIQLVDVSPEGQERNLVSIVKAHKSNIRFIALNRTGTMVASASDTGTIIRVHSTQTTALIFEFRRGIDRAVITSMKFSPNDSNLAVLSDKKTLHVFNLIPLTTPATPSAPSSDAFGDGESLREIPTNRQHLLNKVRLPLPMLNYFQSTWSFCSVNTSQYHMDSQAGLEDDIAKIGWSGDDTIIMTWTKKKIWEKYMIIDSSKARPKSYADAVPPKQSSTSHASRYKIVRSSWKSFDQAT